MTPPTFVDYYDLSQRSQEFVTSNRFVIYRHSAALEASAAEVAPAAPAATPVQLH